MRVAGLVAVHPDLPAFVMQRVDGDSRFAQIPDAAAQESIARQFVDQLATLHRLDPSALDLPELGRPGDALAAMCSTRSPSGSSSTRPPAVACP